MGFVREAPQYRLNFEGDEFEGLEVMARSLPLGEFFELVTLDSRARTDPSAAQEAIRRLSEVLVSWNLEDDLGKVPCAYSVCRSSGLDCDRGSQCASHASPDGPPCTVAGLVGLDLPFMLTIFRAWMTALAGVPKGSLSESSAGGTSLEPSIPMDLS